MLPTDRFYEPSYFSNKFYFSADKVSIYLREREELFICPFFDSVFRIEILIIPIFFRLSADGVLFSGIMSEGWPLLI
jgi:hypothetical protein